MPNPIKRISNPWKEFEQGRVIQVPMRDKLITVLNREGLKVLGFNPFKPIYGVVLELKQKRK